MEQLGDQDHRGRRGSRRGAARDRHHRPSRFGGVEVLSPIIGIIGSRGVTAAPWAWSVITTGSQGLDVEQPGTGITAGRRAPVADRRQSALFQPKYRPLFLVSFWQKNTLMMMQHVFGCRAKGPPEQPGAPLHTPCRRVVPSRGVCCAYLLGKSRRVCIKVRQSTAVNPPVPPLERTPGRGAPGQIMPKPLENQELAASGGLHARYFGQVEQLGDQDHRGRGGPRRGAARGRHHRALRSGAVEVLSPIVGSRGVTAAPWAWSIVSAGSPGLDVEQLGDQDHRGRRGRHRRGSRRGAARDRHHRPSRSGGVEVLSPIIGIIGSQGVTTAAPWAWSIDAAGSRGITGASWA